jgi:hypothetical protein
VNKIVIWLRQGHTHTDPTLATILSDYLLSRGSKRLDAINLPAGYQRFAYSQDMIGWDNFMLGMISTHLRPIQYSYLLGSASMLTVDDWMKKFIDQLIHIVHGQWIYRNISKYHETLGSIRKTERQQLLLEIDRLMNLTPEDVPEESKFLLEVGFARLRTGDLTGQHYWVHAVKAAVMERRRKTFLSRQQRAAPSGRHLTSLNNLQFPTACLTILLYLYPRF